MDITEKILSEYNSLLIEDIENTRDEQQVLDSYLQAAAVLHYFDPLLLNPLDKVFESSGPPDTIKEYILRAPGEHATGLYTLKLEIRRAYFWRFKNAKEIIEAIELNPERPKTILQHLWEDYLKTSKVPEINLMGHGELTAMMVLSCWLEGFAKKFPSPEKVRRLMNEKSVLLNFEHLVASTFTGREKELAFIRSRVRLNRFDQTDKKILSIFGAGGIGKSSLIGRFLIDALNQPIKERIILAYLAFDQSSLRIDDPYSLIIEATAQFKLQLPDDFSKIDKFNEEIRRFRDFRRNIGRRDEVYASHLSRLDDSKNRNDEMYLKFAELLSSFTISGEGLRPVVLVLDTFEEVIYKDRESLAGLWRMLGAINKSYPYLNIIISGRTSIRELYNIEGLEELSLGRLSMEDSVILMEKMGLKSAAAEKVFKYTGGNPLSLKLAVNLILSEPLKYDNQSASSWQLFDNKPELLGDEMVQGMLYHRILDHIHLPEVRILAHPGMVLRKISPQLIQKVLIPALEISSEYANSSIFLFEELKREHTLVRMGDRDTLEFRPEVRNGMIRLLKRDKYVEVCLIHRLAISYYMTGEETLEDRAEEMYHRLALGEDTPYQLDPRWIPGLESSVLENLEEYCDEMKVWLASKTSLELPRAIFKKADLKYWEQNVTRKVRQAILSLSFQNALLLLAERTERTNDSPLFALEAKIYRLKEEKEKALEVLFKGIKQVSKSLNNGRIAELYYIASQVYLEKMNLLNAAEVLEVAARIIGNPKNPVSLIQILSHLYFVTESINSYRERNDLRNRLMKACENLSVNHGIYANSVLGMAIICLGEEHPKTVERLKEMTRRDFVFNQQMLVSENLLGLEEFWQDWEIERGDSEYMENIL